MHQTRAQNFKELNEQIRHIIDTTDSSGSNMMLEMMPNTYNNLIGDILGASIARFIRLENPSAWLYDALKGTNDGLLAQLQPRFDFVNGTITQGKSVSEADIFDFLEYMITRGEGGEQVADTIDLLPALRQKYESFTKAHPDSKPTAPEPKELEPKPLESTQEQGLKEANSSQATPTKPLESNTPQDSLESPLTEPKQKTIDKIESYAKTDEFKALSQEKQEAILSLKEISPAPMPQEITQESLDNLFKHFNSKQDKAQREFYAKLFNDTKDNPHFILEVKRDNELRQEYIKAYQHKPTHDLYYIAITQENDGIKVTGYPITKIKDVINQIKNAEKIVWRQQGDQTHTALAFKEAPSLESAENIIPQANTPKQTPQSLFDEPAQTPKELESPAVIASQSEAIQKQPPESTAPESKGEKIFNQADIKLEKFSDFAHYAKLVGFGDLSAEQLRSAHKHSKSKAQPSKWQKSLPTLKC